MMKSALLRKTPKKTPAMSAKKTPEMSAKKTPAMSAKKTPAMSAKKTPEMSAKKTPAMSAKQNAEMSAKQNAEMSAKKTPEMSAKQNATPTSAKQNAEMSAKTSNSKDVSTGVTYKDQEVFHTRKGDIQHQQENFRRSIDIDQRKRNLSIRRYSYRQKCINEILLLCISECSVTPRVIWVLAFHAGVRPPTPIRERIRGLGSGVGITIIATGIVRVAAFLPLVGTPSPIFEIDRARFGVTVFVIAAGIVRVLTFLPLVGPPAPILNRLLAAALTATTAGRDFYSACRTSSIRFSNEFTSIIRRTGRPSGRRPSGRRPSGRRPSGRRPSGRRPSRRRSSFVALTATTAGRDFYSACRTSSIRFSNEFTSIISILRVYGIFTSSPHYHRDDKHEYRTYQHRVLHNYTVIL